MKMKSIATLALLIASLFTACSWLEDEKVLPPATGKSGELVLVVSEALWSDSLKARVQEHFMRLLDGIPQEEPLFSIVQIPPMAFNSIFQTHRNILEIRLHAQNKGLKKVKELYAKPQLHLRLEAPSETELWKLLDEQGQQMADIFWQEELKRQAAFNRKNVDQALKSQLKEEQGFTLDLPKDFYPVKGLGENTYHFRKDLPNATLGIVVRKSAYMDPYQLGLPGVIAERNELLRENVLGERHGSYMQTEERYLPLTENLERGAHGIRVRGLWNMHRDFMGGPFIHDRILDPQGQYLISIDAYAYCPDSKKRNIVLELESILESFRFEAKSSD